MDNKLIEGILSTPNSDQLKELVLKELQKLANQAYIEHKELFDRLKDA